MITKGKAYHLKGDYLRTTATRARTYILSSQPEQYLMAREDGGGGLPHVLIEDLKIPIVPGEVHEIGSTITIRGIIAKRFVDSDSDEFGPYSGDGLSICALMLMDDCGLVSFE